MSSNAYELGPMLVETLKTQIRHQGKILEINKAPKRGKTRMQHLQMLRETNKTHKLTWEKVHQKHNNSLTAKIKETVDCQESIDESNTKKCV